MTLSDIKNILSSCSNYIDLYYFPLLKGNKEDNIKMYSDRYNICNSCVYGCGCLIKCKAAKADNHCIVGKW